MPDRPTFVHLARGLQLRNAQPTVARVAVSGRNRGRGAAAPSVGSPTAMRATVRKPVRGRAAVAAPGARQVAKLRPVRTLNPRVLSPKAVRPGRVVAQPAIAKIDPRIFRRGRLSDVLVGHRATTGGRNGVDRNSLRVPVRSASGKLSDTQLFEAPEDPSHKLYLPSYAIAEGQVASGSGTSSRLRVEHVPGRDGSPGSLRVHLALRPPAGVDPNASGAEPMDHEADVFLSIERPLAGSAVSQDRRAFAALTEQPDGTLLAEMPFEDAAERLLVQNALADSSLRARLVVVRKLEIAVPMGGRRTGFRVLPWTVECVVDPVPFVFRGADAVFGGPPPAGGSTALLRRTVEWQGQHQVYFQDQLQPADFFFLPDRFLIAREEILGADRSAPLVSVRFETAAGDGAAVEAVMEYAARPSTDAQRLEHAAGELARHAGGEAPRFIPLEAPELPRLRLGLPGGSGFQVREHARVDLVEGVVDVLRLPLDEFQSVFDALFGASQVVLQGEVVLDLGADAVESVEFSGRFDRFDGDPLRTEEVTVDGDSVAVKLINCIESPVEFDALPARLVRGEEDVAGVLEGLDLSAPVTLAAGASLEFVVRPGATLGGEGGVDAVFDLSGVRVLPDREALWAAIVDPHTPATYSKTVTVRSLASIFEPTAERPADPIGAVLVEFEGNDTVELGPSETTVTTQLRMPIADLVLGRVDKGSFRYRVIVVRASGQQTDPDWTVGTATRFFPNVQR